VVGGASSRSPGAAGPVVSRADLVAGLAALGVAAGDVLFAHSSLSSLGWVDGGADAVADALIEAVGPAGLAAVPTHTWDTVHARQPVFHARLTPSIVGAVTEAFRRRPAARRSLHPTHSVAAIGLRAEAFVQGHEGSETPCSRDTPYGRLCSWGGKVLFLGVGLSSWTLVHAFEEWAPVPWLFDRWETLYTVRDDGTVITVPSRRHTRDPHCRRDYPALEPLLRQEGLITYGRIGRAEVRLVDAAGAERLLVPLLRRRPDLVLAERAAPVC
jgi:aminoglycoside 3-N-acetyltransferase